jgi:hypothetical protein
MCLQKVSVAVTWIAVKIEEQYSRVRLRDLIMVFNVLQQREDQKYPYSIILENPDSDRFRQVQAEIAAQYEMGVFKALGFICHVDPPHKILTNLLGLIFFDAESRKINIPKNLAQVCSLLQMYFFFRTSVVECLVQRSTRSCGAFQGLAQVRYEPERIYSSCINLARVCH